jgi:hypothetical protein
MINLLIHEKSLRNGKILALPGLPPIRKIRVTFLHDERGKWFAAGSLR